MFSLYAVVQRKYPKFDWEYLGHASVDTPITAFMNEQSAKDWCAETLKANGNYADSFYIVEIICDIGEVQHGAILNFDWEPIR